MARWRIWSLVLPVALSLGACQGTQPTARPSAPVADTNIRGTTASDTFKSIVGAVEGFSNTRKRFTAAEGEKVVLELETENAAKLGGISGLKIDPGTGSFSIGGLVDNGNYFLRAKFADGYEEEALVVVERSNTNILHAGSSLVAAWLRDQLGRKLIFLPDLPAEKLQPLAATVQNLLFDEQGVTKAPAGSAERLAAFDKLVAANSGVSGTVRALEAQFSSTAALNVRTPPSHTRESDYKAKVEAFKTKFNNPAGIGDPTASGT